MPKRISKPKRRGPSELTKSWAEHFSIVNSRANIIEQILSAADSLPRCNITTGPERTPLGVMTPAQVEAYKKQRLDSVLVKADDEKLQELP